MSSALSSRPRDGTSCFRMVFSLVLYRDHDMQIRRGIRKADEYSFWGPSLKTVDDSFVVILLTMQFVW